MQRAFVQIAYFVPDVRAAAEVWARERGAGPFLVLDNIELGQVVYRGSASQLDHSSAYGQLGDLMLELVQQNDTTPSAFSEMFTPGETGLHHMAQFAPDFAAELQRYQGQGFEIAMTAQAGEVPFAFIDTRPALGHMTEIYQDCDAIRNFYQLVASLSQDAEPGQVFAELPIG